MFYKLLKPILIKTILYNYLFFGDFVLFAKFKTDLIYLYLGFKELVSNTRRMSIVVDKNID